MEFVTNELGQKIGRELTNWQAPPHPPQEAMEGRFCWLMPLDAGAHGAELFAANSEDKEGRMWTYLPYGPFPNFDAYQQWLAKMAAGNDPQFFTVIDKATEKPVGLAAYLRIDPMNGSIEVGHLAYSPRMQRTPVATETMFLMMARAFALGYRRYEWKCHSLNEPSRAAARRLGFAYEGKFRQAAVVKGRSRDTVWFSIIDRDWPELKMAFERWLDPANFDENGKQRARLSDLTRPVVEKGEGHPAPVGPI